MNPYTFHKVQEAYFARSQYEPSLPYEQPDSLFQWPGNRYFDNLKKDVPLLHESLSPQPEAQEYPSTLADQVFGHQKREQRISVKHLINLLYERSRFHYRHLKDIDSRLMDCHSRLSVARMLSPMRADMGQVNLERLIVALEKERRKEELSFWKDSRELRQELFEHTREYGATARRARMLSGLEGENA